MGRRGTGRCQDRAQRVVAEVAVERGRDTVACDVRAHHGAITGLDRFRESDSIIVVGRPAMNRLAGEQLAEIIRGSSVGVLPAEGSLWPTVAGGIRLSSGTAAPVEQP